MVIIVTGGEIDKELLREYLQGEHGDIDAILAADSGVKALLSYGAKPDYLVGDFDSFDGDVEELLSDPAIITKRLNPIKDDTDTESALNWAIELIKAGRITLSAREFNFDIVILGATGGRIDHLLANISILGIGIKDRLSIGMADTHNRIRMLSPGSYSIEKKNTFGAYVSTFPFQGKVSGLTLEGFKYPLKDYEMYGFNSLGVSNEITEEIAHISFTDGYLLVVESKDR